MEPVIRGASRTRQVDDIVEELLQSAATLTRHELLARLQGGKA